MKLLIKLGGTLLDSPESCARLATEITGLAHAVVVVHGGGKQMTRYLAERNVESRFVNGLRVTTPEVIDAVLKVFAGTVNTELVGAFRAAGARPVGLTGRRRQAHSLRRGAARTAQRRALSSRGRVCGRRREGLGL